MKKIISLLLILSISNFYAITYASNITVKLPNNNNYDNSQYLQVDDSSYYINEQYNFSTSTNSATQNQSTDSSNKVLKGSIVQIAKGTPLNVYLQEGINTATAKNGTIVTTMLKDDLLINNSIAIPQGSFVKGTITDAKPASNPNKNGKVSIVFNSLELPNWEVYKINTEKVDFEVEDDGSITSNISTAAGALVLAAGAGAVLSWWNKSNNGSSESTTSSLATGAAIGAGVLAVVALGSYLLSKGKDAEIPQYTELSLILNNSINVAANQY